jgi:signal peptidase
MARNLWLIPVVRDVTMSIVIVSAVLGGLFLFSGLWPPMVVIESGSMQHSNLESNVGVIDTGDLTIVRSIEKVDSVITWVEGRETGYTSYGDFGDVIVFHKNGVKETTPVIHRALVYVELNGTTGDSFDVPSMGLRDVRRMTIVNLTSYHTGVRTVTDMDVDLDLVLRNFEGVKDPHGGFLTKGDNNPNVDQISLFMDEAYENTTRRAEPIRQEWVVGVSRGELPWFGVLKLMFSVEGGNVPTNSIHNLLLTIALLVTVPTLLDLTLAVGLPRLRARVHGRKDEGPSVDGGTTDMPPASDRGEPTEETVDEAP